MWKPHALARPHADQLDLRMGDKVRSIVELHGTEIGDLDGRHIEPYGKTVKRLEKAEKKAARR